MRVNAIITIDLNGARGIGKTHLLQTVIIPALEAAGYSIQAGVNDNQVITSVRETLPDIELDLYVVRVYDGFDNIWTDVSEPVPKEEAKKIWAEKTDNGNKLTSYNDINYYEIFPSNIRMLYSDPI